MELSPVRPSGSIASDSDVIVTTSSSSSDGHDDLREAGSSTASCGCLSPARVDFLKRNIPSVISLFSVVLNVIILSALIPSLRHDVTFVQGQASSIQSTVNTLQQSLLTINDKINGADTAVTTFNRQLADITQSVNATKIEIAGIQQNAIGDIQALAATTLGQLNSSLVSVAALTIIANNLQVNLGTSVTLLQNISSASIASLESTAAAAKADLLAINTSVTLNAANFITNILPLLSNDLLTVKIEQSVLTGQIQLLANQSYIDPLHIVGDPATGLATTWVNMLPYYDQTLYPGFRVPRFWVDRNIVHLEGMMKSSGCNAPCVAFTLPPGYRPLDPENGGRVFGIAAAGSFVQIAIFSNGVVQLDGTATAQVCLDGISFLRNTSVPFHG
jgi:hypothetical protein